VLRPRPAAVPVLLPGLAATLHAARALVGRHWRDERLAPLEVLAARVVVLGRSLAAAPVGFASLPVSAGARHVPLALSARAPLRAVGLLVGVALARLGAPVLRNLLAAVRLVPVDHGSSRGTDGRQRLPRSA
jgi:hypothetical protein